MPTLVPSTPAAAQVPFTVSEPARCGSAVSAVSTLRVLAGASRPCMSRAARMRPVVASATTNAVAVVGGSGGAYETACAVTCGTNTPTLTTREVAASKDARAMTRWGSERMTSKTLIAGGLILRQEACVGVVSGSDSRTPGPCRVGSPRERQQIAEGGYADDREARWCARRQVADQQARPGREDGDRRGQRQADKRTGRQAMGGARRGSDQAEQEQRADCLRSLRAGHADDNQESCAEQSNRYTTRDRDRFVEAGEQQRSRNECHGEADSAADEHRRHCLRRGDSEDRTEEIRRARSSIPAAVMFGVQALEQRAEAQYPSKRRADDDVVGSGPASEHREPASDGDGSGEQPE